jgi:hypothetical protein
MAMVMEVLVVVAIIGVVALTSRKFGDSADGRSSR